MPRQEAFEHYGKALKMGLKEYRERSGSTLSPYPQVLDDILSDIGSTQYVGLVEIPSDRIVGVKSAGRVSALSAGFYPLLEPDTEFAAKWISLCDAHLSDDGIRDPISCFEYMGYFFVQEGNKRVSVLRYFDSPLIPGVVQRILPMKNGDPRVRAYYEFLDFYQSVGTYSIMFQKPGGYAKLLKAVGKSSGDEWTSDEKKKLTIGFGYFKEAFHSLGGGSLNVTAEDALLRWLQVYDYSQLTSFTSSELEKSLSSIWSNITTISESVDVNTEPVPEKKSGIISRIIAPVPEHLNIAFVHAKTPDVSDWVQSHEKGRAELEETFGNKLTVKSYFGADSPEKADEILNQAVEDGADVLFTTAVQLVEPCLKLLAKYPKLRVYNCSVNMPYSNVRGYYSRLYESKFIMGAIAGAIAEDGRIGYAAAYPILGETASINAFALGAKMTNPRAAVRLEWSCLPGRCMDRLIDAGYRIISAKDAPVADKMQTAYGVCLLDANRVLIPLASPCSIWGCFYIRIVDAILKGSSPTGKAPSRAVSYWWGMKSGASTVTLTDKLPDGVRHLAEILRKGIMDGTIDPFFQTIRAQDGTVKNDGTHSLSPEEILEMDYLVEGVDGEIPEYSRLLPMARDTVRLLGIRKDDIPPEELKT